MVLFAHERVILVRHIETKWRLPKVQNFVNVFLGFQTSQHKNKNSTTPCNQIFVKHWRRGKMHVGTSLESLVQSHNQKQLLLVTQVYPPPFHSTSPTILCFNFTHRAQRLDGLAHPANYIISTSLSLSLAAGAKIIKHILRRRRRRETASRICGRTNLR